MRSHSGCLSEKKHGLDLRQFQREKLVFQNIIAHVARPQPRIILIGAHDPNRTVTLDTVNNLIARDSAIDLYGLLGLLHSEFMNWFVYSVIYNKSIRTMHFDQYFLDKIPLPEDFVTLLGRIAPLARRCCTAAEAIAELSQAAIAAIKEETNQDLSLRDMALLLSGGQPGHEQPAVQSKRARFANIERHAGLLLVDWKRRFSGLVAEQAEAFNKLNIIVDQAYQAPLESRQTS